MYPITYQQFHQSFKDTKNTFHFPYGLKALYDYLMGDSQVSVYLIDLTSICENYEEFKNLKDFQDYYGYEYETFEDIEAVTEVIYTHNSKDTNVPFIIRLF